MPGRTKVPPATAGADSGGRRTKAIRKAPTKKTATKKLNSTPANKPNPQKKSAAANAATSSPPARTRTLDAWIVRDTPTPTLARSRSPLRSLSPGTPPVGKKAMQIKPRSSPSQSPKRSRQRHKREQISSTSATVLSSEMSAGQSAVVVVELDSSPPTVTVKSAAQQLSVTAASSSEVATPNEAQLVPSVALFQNTARQEKQQEVPGVKHGVSKSSAARHGRSAKKKECRDGNQGPPSGRFALDGDRNDSDNSYSETTGSNFITNANGSRRSSRSPASANKKENKTSIRGMTTFTRKGARSPAVMTEEQANSPPRAALDPAPAVGNAVEKSSPPCTLSPARGDTSVARGSRTPRSAARIIPPSSPSSVASTVTTAFESITVGTMLPMPTEPVESPTEAALMWEDKGKVAKKNKKGRRASVSTRVATAQDTLADNNGNAADAAAAALSTESMDVEGSEKVITTEECDGSGGATNGKGLSGGRKVAAARKSETASPKSLAALAAAPNGNRKSKRTARSSPASSMLTSIEIESGTVAELVTPAAETDTSSIAGKAQNHEASLLSEDAAGSAPASVTKKKRGRPQKKRPAATSETSISTGSCVEAVEGSLTPHKKRKTVGKVGSGRVSEKDGGLRAIPVKTSLSAPSSNTSVVPKKEKKRKLSVTEAPVDVMKQSEKQNGVTAGKNGGSREVRGWQQQSPQRLASSLPLSPPPPPHVSVSSSSSGRGNKKKKAKKAAKSATVASSPVTTAPEADAPSVMNERLLARIQLIAAAGGQGWGPPPVCTQPAATEPVAMETTSLESAAVDREPTSKIGSTAQSTKSASPSEELETSDSVKEPVKAKSQQGESAQAAEPQSESVAAKKPETGVTMVERELVSVENLPYPGTSALKQRELESGSFPEHQDCSAGFAVADMEDVESKLEAEKEGEPSQSQSSSSIEELVQLLPIAVAATPAEHRQLIPKQTAPPPLADEEREQNKSKTSAVVPKLGEKNASELDGETTDAGSLVEDATAAADDVTGSVSQEMAGATVEKAEKAEAQENDKPEREGEPEEELEEHVMVGDVMQVRCRLCRTRFSRAGCSSSGCFDCCFKAAKPCTAHAKQLERKRVEDDLLAGGPTPSQRSEDRRRLPKGVFKEESIHAIGDTATVWCFMDFVCSKSNQGTFKTLSRARRASEGRKPPRSSRRASSSSRTVGREHENENANAARSAKTATADDATATAASPANGGISRKKSYVRPAVARWRRKHVEMFEAVSDRSAGTVA